MGHGDPAGLFGHDDDDRVGFFGYAHGGAVAHSVVGEGGIVGDGEKAVGAGEPAVADYRAAVVERQRRREERDDKFGGYHRVERRSRLFIASQGDAAFEREQRAHLPGREILDDFDEEFRGQNAVAVLAVFDAAESAYRRQKPAYFGLEYHDGRYREIDEQIFYQQRQNMEVQKVGYKSEKNEHAHAEQRLIEARTFRALQYGVDYEKENSYFYYRRDRFHLRVFRSV